MLAGQEFASSGQSVRGAPPAENEDVLRRMVFVREDQAYPDFKVGHALRLRPPATPNWDGGLALAARRLRAAGGHGQDCRAACAPRWDHRLAAGAELTLFDEPDAGRRGPGRSSTTGCWRTTPSSAGRPAVHPSDRRPPRSRERDRHRRRPDRARRGRRRLRAWPPRSAARSSPWTSSPPGARSGTGAVSGRRRPSSRSGNWTRPLGEGPVTGPGPRAAVAAATGGARRLASRPAPIR